MTRIRAWNVPLVVSSAAGTLALIAGLVSFLGWAADVYRFTDWDGSGIAIKANAAVAAAVAGIGLLLAVQTPFVRAVQTMGAFVAALGGLTLFEHLTGWNLGIDTLLFDEPAGAAATVSPGRMGPPAASSFLAIGMALVLRTNGARGRAFSVALGLIVFSIGTLSLTGYWYGAQAIYAVARYTGIATQTASMIVALGIGLIAASPDRQPVRTLVEDSAAGALARRLVPSVILLPLILGWLRVRGQQLALYDTAFGTAIRSLIEAGILGAVLWWSLQSMRTKDSQRQHAQRQLADTERRLAQTLDSITDGFVTLSEDWRFTYVNEESARLLQKSRAELPGEVIWELLPRISATPLRDELVRAAAHRITAEVEVADLAGDGRHLLCRLYPAAEGGVSIYFRDVTERVRAEAALRESNRRKDEFLATLAHELRNPLAPIRNAAKLLLAKGLAEEKLQWGAEVITRQVAHMARLLEDLLDISRISRNRLELRKEWVDIATIVQSALEASRPLIDSAQHELTVDLPALPVFIDADPVRMTQVSRICSTTPQSTPSPEATCSCASRLTAVTSSCASSTTASASKPRCSPGSLKCLRRPRSRTIACQAAWGSASRWQRA